jgi:hypothetical protein
VSPDLLPWALLAGAATLAFWVAARFPALAPRSTGAAAVRVCIALTFVGAIAPAFAVLRTIMDRPVALILVTLPSGAALILSATWLVVSMNRATASLR